jgi:hypothetical protein
MLVTLHLAEGQTAKQLISEVAALAGGVRPRSVSGRFGVLVDAELAYRYLAARYAPPPPPPPPAVVAAVVEPTPEPAPAPVKKAPVKKPVTKAATSKGE